MDVAFNEYLTERLLFLEWQYGSIIKGSLRYQIFPQFESNWHEWVGGLRLLDIKI